VRVSDRAPTRTLGCRVRRRQTVRAEGRVGEGSARGPRPGVCEQQEDLAAARHRYATQEIDSPRACRGCFRDCLFHNAPDVYCHATSLPHAARRDRNKGQGLAPPPPRRRSPTPKPQAGISPEADSLAQPGASFAELPSRRSQKKPGQQRDGEGKGRGVPLPPEPAGAARKAAGAAADGALAPPPASRSPVSWRTK
jgi:hypothetical protein